jgi:branched-chain amino acid transport system substrate-binding protein
MEKINYFPSLLTSWAADNITFYDAAGKKLSGHPLFMRTMVGAETAKQKALFGRLKGKLAAPGSFPFAVHGYDATLLVAAAMRQAGSTEGSKVREALESLKAPVEGVKKTYTQPCSSVDHEGLGANDYMFVRWNDGALGAYSDAIIKSFTAADFKR